MELALATFMTSIGFTFAEVLKMLTLVALNFVFMGALTWRARKPIKELYILVTDAMRSVPAMQVSISELNKTMQEHIIQTDLRIDSVEENLSDLKKSISDIANISIHNHYKE